MIDYLIVYSRCPPLILVRPYSADLCGTIAGDAKYCTYQSLKLLQTIVSRSLLAFVHLPAAAADAAPLRTTSLTANAPTSYDCIAAVFLLVFAYKYLNIAGQPINNV